MRLVLAVVGALIPGPFGRAYCRTIMGAQIGRGARIGFGTVIWANDITIGPQAKIGRFCRIKADRFRLDSYAFIAGSVRISVYECHMHSRSILGSNTTVSGDPVDPRSVIVMGMHSWIFQDCFIDVTRQVTMGRNVGVGGGTYIFTHGFWLSKLDGYPVALGPVTMGDDVWLPWGCFILPGVTVGSGVVMGARALVNKDVPSGALIGGIPAKVIRERSNLDLSQAARIGILEEATEEYAAYHSKHYEKVVGLTWIDLFVDTTRVLRIHVRADPPWEIAEEGLNVISCSIDGLGNPETQWWSMSDSRSSAFATFSESTRSWFEYERRIGLRFYPVDEVAQYDG